MNSVELRPTEVSCDKLDQLLQHSDSPAISIYLPPDETADAAVLARVVKRCEHLLEEDYGFSSQEIENYLQPLYQLQQQLRASSRGQVIYISESIFEWWLCTSPQAFEIWVEDHFFVLPLFCEQLVNSAENQQTGIFWLKDCIQQQLPQIADDPCMLSKAAYNSRVETLILTSEYRQLVPHEQETLNRALIYTLLNGGTFFKLPALPTHKFLLAFLRY